MTHHMKLTSSAFSKIAKGSKTIELRINDEKRQKINTGDTVVFNCNENSDIITARVKQLHKFADFESLYNALPLDKCGYAESELGTANHTDMEQYYSTEKIKKYGALGIELCDVYSICDVKDKLSDSAILDLLASSVFNSTPKRLLSRAEKYQADDKIKVYAYSENGEYKGIIVFKTKEQAAEILNIAVKPECQGKGIGSRLIDYIFSQFSINKITAETDDDSIEFYKKYGFTVADTKDVFDRKRYICVCESVTHHYDLLINENNDPVHDPKTLRDYMDKWDGQGFIDSMELDNKKSVLEIGVGTGRLAVRVAPLCSQFCGIDISPKTIDQANENLSKYRNVDLICADFLSYEFGRAFDVIYSSLTFMHIEDKQRAVNKIAGLLNDAGRFVLSIDKNPSEFIDTGTRKIRIFPSTPVEMAECIRTAGLTILNRYDTEFATIFVAQKDG